MPMGRSCLPQGRRTRQCLAITVALLSLLGSGTCLHAASGRIPNAYTGTWCHLGDSYHTRGACPTKSNYAWIRIAPDLITDSIASCSVKEAGTVGKEVRLKMECEKSGEVRGSTRSLRLVGRNGLIMTTAGSTNQGSAAVLATGRGQSSPEDVETVEMKKGRTSTCQGLIHDALVIGYRPDRCTIASAIAAKQILAVCDANKRCTTVVKFAPRTIEELEAQEGAHIKDKDQIVSVRRGAAND
jgi:hypothetical protein